MAMGAATMVAAMARAMGAVYGGWARLLSTPMGTIEYGYR